MCGNKNTSTTTSTAPNPQAMQAYSDLLGRASGVAATPYTPYTGELVAPVNAQQQSGIGNINANANFAQPFIGQAAGFATQAAAPITAAQIAQYQSPYTQQVVQATENQFNNQNAQQQQQILGNAAAQGALGGDRVGVAQGIAAGQQQLAQAPVIAGLYNQGYGTALSTGLAEQQNLGNAAYSLGNLGVAGQNAALTGAGAQVGAGSLEQQTQQAADAAQLQQFYQQQAYPFQTTQWLAGIDTGVGSQMGGTSQTTPPAPNPWNTILGLGVAGLGAFSGNPAMAASGAASAGDAGVRHGGRIHRDIGGGIPNTIGGVPYAGVAGYVPTMQIARGQGAPKPPGVPTQQNPLSNFSGDLAAGKGIGNLWNKYGNSSGGSYQDIGSAPEAGFGMGPLYAKGGRATLSAPILLRRGYDDGGVVAGFGGSMLPPPSFDERFANANSPTFDQRFGPPPAPVPPAIYNALQDYGTTQPDALNGLLAEPMPQAPGAPPRPATVAGNPDLPPEIATGTSRPAPTDIGDTPLALGYTPSDIGATPVAPDSAHAAATPAGGGVFGLNLSPSVRAGLLSAGLGIMASRSPYLGQAIGAGGLQGVAAYSGEQKQELAAKKTQADIDSGKQRLAQAAKAEADRIAMETKRLQQADEQHKASLAESRRQHDMSLKAPVKIGETRSGVPVMALPRLNPNGNIDYYPINQDGSIAPAPLGQGNGAAPALSPGTNAVPGQPPGPSSALPPSATRMAALDTGSITDAPPVEVRAQMPTASPQARNEAYLAQIAKDDPRYAAEIKSIADYQMNPNQLFSLRGNRRERAMGDLVMYDPTYDQRRYAQTNRAISGWAQSPEGRSTRSLSVAVDHLGNAEELGQALQNGDVQVVNRFKNWAKQQLGYEGPVNFDFARQIVSDEIAKAVIGGQNAEGDRRGLQDLLSRASSPEQLVGAVRTAKQLMAGQLNGLRSTYEQATGLHNFDNWLTPRARQEIQAAAATHAQAAPGQNAAPAARSAQDQQAIDWANMNPTDPRAAKIKQRLGVQ